MGHLVNPISFRLGRTQTWKSDWYVSGATNYALTLKDDFLLYNYLESFFKYSKIYKKHNVLLGVHGISYPDLTRQQKILNNRFSFFRKRFRYLRPSQRRRLRIRRFVVSKLVQKLSLIFSHANISRSASSITFGLYLYDAALESRLAIRKWRAKDKRFKYLKRFTRHNKLKRRTKTIFYEKLFTFNLQRLHLTHLLKISNNRKRDSLRFKNVVSDWNARTTFYFFKQNYFSLFKFLWLLFVRNMTNNTQNIFLIRVLLYLSTLLKKKIKIIFTTFKKKLSFTHFKKVKKKKLAAIFGKKVLKIKYSFWNYLTYLKNKKNESRNKLKISIKHINKRTKSKTSFLFNPFFNFYKYFYNLKLNFNVRLSFSNYFKRNKKKNTKFFYAIKKNNYVKPVKNLKKVRVFSSYKDFIKIKSKSVSFNSFNRFKSFRRNKKGKYDRFVFKNNNFVEELNFKKYKITTNEKKNKKKRYFYNSYSKRNTYYVKPTFYSVSNKLMLGVKGKRNKKKRFTLFDFENPLPFYMKLKTFPRISRKYSYFTPYRSNYKKRRSFLNKRDTNKKNIRKIRQKWCLLGALNKSLRNRLKKLFLFLRKTFTRLTLFSLFLLNNMKKNGLVQGIFFNLRYRIWFYVSRILHENIKTLLKLSVDNKVSLITFKYFGLNNKSVTAQMIAHYMSIKLYQKYTIFEILRPVTRDLTRNRTIDGFKITCAGRLSKKQRASLTIQRTKRVSLNTIDSFVDYATSFSRLRHGVCGLKVWITRKPTYKPYSYVFNFTYLTHYNK